MKACVKTWKKGCLRNFCFGLYGNHFSIINVLKASHLGAFAIGHNGLVPWIQTSLSYKQKIVFNKSKKKKKKKYLSLLFCGKKRRRGFALFKGIFLRNQSLSNARWFYQKKMEEESVNV